MSPPNQERPASGARDTNLDLLRKARERTNSEMLKYGARFGSSQGTTIAAVAAVALLPAADAAGVTDALADALGNQDITPEASGYARRRR